MKMIMLTINNQQVTVADGSTVMHAAEALGVRIPTLCYLKEFTPNTNCMICVVHELKSDRLVLSCSLPAGDGMVIETEDERVREARKDTLDLLLSEHVGDCEAPCQKTCPAKMNIPLMIRQIKEQKFDEALVTVKNDIALPAVLGRICPAPCENGCNRKSYDTPVSICSLKRFVADTDLASESPYKPDTLPKSGKKVAIIGAGPTGLSAAYYLARLGHECCMYDRNDKPGGLLRNVVPAEKLPESVLDSEIKQILTLGVELRPGLTLGTDFTLAGLRAGYDAVVLAFGKADKDALITPEIEMTARGISVNRKTFETTMAGVFAGGNAVSEGKMAIRSLAHGKTIANSVHQYVNGLAVTGETQRFNSQLGKLLDGETDEFIKEADVFDQVRPDGGFETGYSAEEAVKESNRCFHCDCRKPDTCKLRQYSEEYGADQRRYKFGQRKRFRKSVQHEFVVFEQGKCIKCNACIEITKRAGEQFGFAFINRGFDVQLIVPFDESLADGLRKAAKECVETCPTAALAWRTGEQGDNPVE